MKGMGMGIEITIKNPIGGKGENNKDSERGRKEDSDIACNV